MRVTFMDSIKSKHPWTATMVKVMRLILTMGITFMDRINSKHIRPLPTRKGPRRVEITKENGCHPYSIKVMRQIMRVMFIIENGSHLRLLTTVKVMRRRVKNNGYRATKTYR